jgi:thioredoxin-dependent peroxiredoxin
MTLGAIMLLSSSAVRSGAALVLVALLGSAGAARAQGTDSGSVSVGRAAPDFSAPGATRYGLLRDPVKLSDFRGQTVVLAFFYKARTKG